MQTKTELHTHLMGMLSAEKFIELIETFTDIIYWPVDEPIEENQAHRYIKYLNSAEKEELIRKISVPENNTVDYATNLNELYMNRNAIILYIEKKLKKEKPNTDEDFKQTIFNKYINDSLEELINQGVEYVEISYSKVNILANFKVRDDIKEKIKFNFLLCTDRSKSMKSMKQTSKDVENALNNGYAVGFDIMGVESGFTEAELEDKKSNSSHSFKRKLEVIINVLKGKDDTTLRLHSGETKSGRNNTIKTLKMLEELAIENNIVIPPPEIRIGHGIYFEKSDEYIELLKKFKCTIEINASSNYSLQNIKSYKEIPYEYYLNNSIPIVISTDGHGMYDTTIKKEDEIAHNNVSEELYNQIIDIDDEILTRKTRR